MTSQTHFYYTKVMVDLFNKQPEIKNHDEFWKFMEGQLLDGLYWEYWYNDGNDKSYICPGGEERTGPCPIAPSDRNILYENRMLGLPRIRQLRSLITFSTFPQSCSPGSTMTPARSTRISRAPSGSVTPSTRRMSRTDRILVTG